MDFLEEAAFLMGLKEGGLRSKEMMNKDVLGGRDPGHKGVESEESGTWANN